MKLETRNLAAEVTQPVRVPAGVAPRQRVVPDYGANARGQGTPWWMQPADYPLSLPAFGSGQTLLQSTSEFWLIVTRLTAIVTAQTGQDAGVPSYRYPLIVRIRDASRRFPLVPEWAPLQAVFGLGRSCKGWLPAPGWVLPPNTDVLVEVRSGVSVGVDVHMQALASRVLYEGEGGGA